MKILFLTHYDQQSAYSRMRCLQKLPWLEEGAIESVFFPLFNNGVLMQKYRHEADNLLELLIAYRATSPNLLLQKQSLVS